MKFDLKRVLDVTVAGSALLGFGPLFVALASWIKLDSKGPIFYRGARIGRGGKPFRLYKFRSMVEDAESLGGSSTSDADTRVTRPGRFLRAYKLDELPQFINVLLGDMSLVGPRPQVLSYLDRYTEEQKQIFSVRPGITDWASIKFHNEGEILAQSGIADADEAYERLIHPEKTDLQLRYVQQRSFATDVQILFETARTLVQTRTATAKGS
jgi:lipopolysaccharide/colanic/teichoic acid biosynthesis glycosyltransferase